MKTGAVRLWYNANWTMASATGLRPRKDLGDAPGKFCTDDAGEHSGFVFARAKGAKQSGGVGAARRWCVTARSETSLRHLQNDPHLKGVE